jgi:hypothetical protein
MQPKYLRVMSRLIPMGAVGASLLLGSVVPSTAAERPVPLEAPVSERLKAIREAVFVAVGPGEISKELNRDFHLVWGNRWNNWGRRIGRRGWGRPWNNWRNGWPNWNNFWRNW